MEPTTSIRDSIASAMNSEPSAPPVVESEFDSSIEPVFESETLDIAQDSAPASADLNALSETPDQQIEEKPASQEITPGPKSGPKSQGERAPASWRPETREHWASLPEAVRSEVARREAEVTKTLQETAEVRKHAEAFARTIAPYEAYIRAENSNPIQAIDHMMATAVKLRTSTGPELANMLAGLVQQFGTGRFGPNFVEMLDGALAGNTPQIDHTQQQIQNVLQQQLAPVQQFMSQFQQAQVMQQQQLADRASQEVMSFLKQTEFGNDVKQEMADLMEVAQRRGQDLSLQDAYRQACMMNTAVRSALQNRANAKSAQTQADIAQRARSAAVSVSSSGAPMGAPKVQSDNVRDAIEAAIAMNSR